MSTYTYTYICTIISSTINLLQYAADIIDFTTVKYQYGSVMSNTVQRKDLFEATSIMITTTILIHVYIYIHMYIYTHIHIYVYIHLHV
jgi:hypothetical protein